jgi:hypothetical protein
LDGKWLKRGYLLDNRNIAQEKTFGHCVICGTEGTSEHDFICSECGDPLCATLYCSNCHRRLNLDHESAKAFLSDYGYEIEEVAGLIIKISHCGHCLSPDQTADLEIYRIHFDKLD